MLSHALCIGGAGPNRTRLPSGSWRGCRFIAIFALLVFIVAGNVGIVGAAAAKQRVALVVSTSKYANFDAPALPAETVRQIAHSLRGLGLDVAESYNERSAVVRARLTRFAKRVRSADVAIIILAGHMVSGRGFVFYLPRETRADSATEMFLRGIPVKDFVAAAGQARQGLVLALPTPASAQLVGGEYVSQLRAKPKPGANVTVAFSAAESMPVSEIEGATGAAAQSLLRVLRDSSLSASKLVRAVAGPASGVIVGRGRAKFTLAKTAAASNQATDRPTAGAGKVPRADPPKPAGSGAGDKTKRVDVAGQAKLAAETAKQQRELAALRSQLKDLKARLAKTEAAKTAEGREKEAARLKAEQAAKTARQAESRAQAAETKLQSVQRSMEQSAAKARTARRASDAALKDLQGQAAAARSKLDIAQGELAELRKRTGRQSKLEADANAAIQARDLAEQKLAEIQEQLKQAVARAKQAEEQSKQAEAKRAKSDRAPDSSQTAERTTVAAQQEKQSPRPAPVQAAPTVTSEQINASKLRIESLKKLEGRLTSEQRQRIQEFLRSKGFFAGRPSTNFNATVRAAIKKYQASLSADATGYLTPRQLLAVLKRK